MVERYGKAMRWLRDIAADAAFVLRAAVTALAPDEVGAAEAPVEPFGADDYAALHNAEKSVNHLHRFERAA